MRSAEKLVAIQPAIDRNLAYREQKRRERRCFWTRPLGHFYSERGTCLNCGHDADWGAQ